jgi:hypothetical protein
MCRWTWLGALALVAGLAAGGVQAQVSTVALLKVVDADDRLVGTVPAGRWIDGAIDLRVEVPLVIDDKVFRIAVSRDHLEIIDHYAPQALYPVDPLYYQSSDCTGALWLNVTGAEQDLFTRGTIAPPGQTVYVQMSPGPVYRDVTVRSAQHWDGVCEVFDPARVVAAASYAQPLLNLSTVFRPPFRLLPAAVSCPQQLVFDGVPQLTTRR